MSGLDLKGTQTRLLTCTAIMAAGTFVSGALGGMAAGVMSGLVASDLGELAKRLGRDDNILNNDDLARVAGVAIAAVIDAVGESNEFPSYKKDLEELAKAAIECWSELAKIHAFRSADFDPIRETQLPEMFSTEAQKFAEVKALTPSAWKVVIDWLSRIAVVELAENLIDELANRLYHTFAKALREALKKDAEEGGKAFAAMQLMLLGKIIAATKELPDRYQEIAQQLEEMKAKLTPCLPIFSHNRALIEDKTKGQRMNIDTDDIDERQLKINTIYVLVELGEPISAELIADVVRELKPKVRRILREWEQFLRQEEKDGQICYSVYHASFRDFLHLQPTQEEANVSLEDIEDRITNNLRQGL